MKKVTTLALICLGILVTAQISSKKKMNHLTQREHVLPPALKNNPLLQKSPLQYQAPQFDKIKESDFKPAFDYALKENSAEISKIADNPKPATFQNTIVALELSGQDLNRAQIIFGNLMSSDATPGMQKLDEEYAPIFAAHSDQMFLNSKLFKRIHKIYLDRNKLKLDPESLRLVEVYEQNFEIAGANLSDQKKAELKKVNEQLAILSSTFGRKLLAARKAGGVVVDDVKELDGLSADQIAALASDAEKAGLKGKYLIALQNTTQQPLLQYLNNRALRQKLFEASWNRASKGDDNDTRATVEEIAKLRLKKAQILGKPNYAAWSMQDQMAKTPEAAFDLLANLGKASVKKAAAEATEIQDLMNQQNAGITLEPWDWNYYGEQVRKAKYDLDESEIKPYFEVRNVLEKGVFYAAQKLYGITFKPRPDLPVYNPDVVAYEVFNDKGQSIAIYYLDFYTRDSKSGGAWMNNFVTQSKLLHQKPVIVNVFNFQKPATGKPSLVSFDDVITMFHEFGHSLHGMFADQEYPTLSGTNVPRDFVEFPSQFNENWALEPSVLKNYAVHYQTGQPIPQELVDKLKKSQTFNVGYSMTELVAAATLDMGWHTITSDSQLRPADQFENEVLQKYGVLVHDVPTRYHTPYFAHIWGGGYAAGYYAYLWTQMLEANAFQWMEDHGGMTRENGERFKKDILSIGNSEDLSKAFDNFIQGKPSLEPLLKQKGLE